MRFVPSAFSASPIAIAEVKPGAPAPCISRIALSS